MAKILHIFKILPKLEIYENFIFTILQFLKPIISKDKSLISLISYLNTMIN